LSDKKTRRATSKASLNDAERELWHTFAVLNSAISRALDDELRLQANVTLCEYRLLSALASAPGHRLRMRELANLLQLTRGGATRLIDRLEDALFVERGGCANDGRGVWAEITRAGMEQFEAAEVFFVAALRRHFLDRMPVELAASLRGLLEHVETNGLLDTR
jgi:DNA-binding MarR family transcriptional regulator